MANSKKRAANQAVDQVAKRSGFRLSGIGLNWQTAIAAAGIAMIAPFFIRRLMPLLDGRLKDVSASDIELAGKDSVRDVADDLGVGGVTGTLERGVDRIADRLTH